MIRSIFLYENGQPKSLPQDLATQLPGNPSPDAIRALAKEYKGLAHNDPGSFVWLKAQDPTEDEWAYLTRIFDLPQLQVDDAQNSKQRPKLEFDAKRGFLILKELRYLEETSDVETGQVSVFLGPGFVLSIRHGDAAPGSSRALLTRQPRLLAHGPMSVLYAITDVIVDGYLAVSNELDNDVGQAEDLVFQGGSVDTASVVYRLKRENLELRRALAPLVMSARQVMRGENHHIPKPLRPYFSDLGDHLLRAYELADSHDQLLMAMLMAVTSQQDLRQNADMRKISSWAAIIAVPTAIAGIYGMNFQDMPELNEEWGYPVVLAVMASICLVLFVIFKRSKWL